MIRILPLAWLSIVSMGCEELPQVSRTCEHMCEDATRLFGSCLETWGLEWTDAGFDDEAAHQESCEVWSWEVSELHGADKVDAICDDRGALLHDGECSDYSNIDWNKEP